MFLDIDDVIRLFCNEAWLVSADTLVKGVVLLIPVSIILSCWQRSSSAMRHLGWSTAMLGLLLLPVLSAGLPNWKVLPNWMATSPVQLNTVSDVQRPMPFHDQSQIAKLAAAIENTTEMQVPVQRLESELPRRASENPSSITLPPRPDAVIDQRPQERVLSSPGTTPSRVSAWLMGAWSVGTSLLMLRLALSHLGLWRLAQRNQAVTQGRLCEAIERLSRSLRIRAHVRLLLSHDQQIPMTWGLFQPQLLLPVQAEQWDDSRLQSVLTHELSHVKRRDCLTQLVAQVACALHWLNPLAWLAVHRMAQERERACDDVVLSRGIGAADYAEHLVGVASGLTREELSMHGAMAMARPSGLEGRLLLVLNERLNRGSVSWSSRIGTLVAFSSLILPLAMMHAIDSAIPLVATSDPEAVPDESIKVAQAEPVRNVRAEQVAEFANALDALSRAIDTPEFKAADSPQAGATSRMLYRMNSLHPDDRYRLLKTWTLPTADRETIRNFIGLIPDAPPPKVFLQETLPPLDDPVVSTIVMLVAAARDAGKLPDLATEIRPLVDRNVEGARLLDKLIFLVREAGENAKPRLSVVLSDSEVERQFATQQLAYFSRVLWGYRAKALDVIERSGVALKPSPDPGLKHWVPVDLATASNSNAFSSTSWWVALDDRIGHVCSPWVDHLAFAYPLTGTFEISCEPFNGFWSEANVGFGGLMFEAWNQGSNRNQVYPINGHEILLSDKPREFRDQFNRVTINVTPSRLQAAGNDELMFEDSSPSTTSPFLLLRTTWLSAFRKLKITGTPVIPREVALLSGERMEGWMTSFYNELQAPELAIRQQVPGVVRMDDPNAYDWCTTADVLYGRRFADLDSPHRQSGFHHGESWAYFHRPLREAERIRYEFFYQPGDEAVEVHPTLDRVAFLLKPDGVKLHWLTTNRTEEKGIGWIATDNVAEEPANRRGPNPLPLKVGAWNTAGIEIRNGRVRVELNGQLVYERPVEPNWGSRFGLYHDRTKTAARVRNVVLSGDWPQWSPELAANLLERRAPLTAAETDAIRTILTPRLTAQ